MPQLTPSWDPRVKGGGPNHLPWQRHGREIRCDFKSNVLYHYFVILTSSLGSKSNVFYHYFVILPPFSGSKSNVFYHYFGIKPAPDPSPRRSKGEEEGEGGEGGKASGFLIERK